MRREAQHLCSQVAVVFFSRHAHQNFSFYVVMISRMVNQNFFVQTRDENIETEFVLFAFRFLMGRFVSLGQAEQKCDF